MVFVQCDVFMFFVNGLWFFGGCLLGEFDFFCLSAMFGRFWTFEKVFHCYLVILLGWLNSKAISGGGS